jgi:hypothetical protein
MTGYDSYFTLSFMQAGFIVAAGGLLPQLLAFYEMSHTLVWRASSLIMAIPIFLFVAKIPGRRRAATKESIPFYLGFLLLLQFLAGAYLMLHELRPALLRVARPEGAHIHVSLSRHEGIRDFSRKSAWGYRM